MKVKNWFMIKNFDANERIAIATAGDPVIERETEKAALLKWNTDFGSIKRWIPKSCIEEDAVTDDTEAVENSIMVNYKNEEKALYEMFTGKRGAKVKKIGGRKMFTICSDYPTYGAVYLDNGKAVDIHKLQLV